MPLGIRGVPVYPGDVIVADEDGAIVVPRHLADEVAQVDGLGQDLGLGAGLGGGQGDGGKAGDEHDAHVGLARSG